MPTLGVQKLNEDNAGYGFSNDSHELTENYCFKANQNNTNQPKLT